MLQSRMLPHYVNLGVLPFDDLFSMQKSVFMHDLHYKNLPFMLSTYCLPAKHKIITRYISDMNYVIPVARTKRSQTSIKFSGPKVWIDVPRSLKEIVFRKPFSKKLKEHLLSILKVKNDNLPKESTITFDKKDGGVEEIFDNTYDDEFVFYGFSNHEL